MPLFNPFSASTAISIGSNLLGGLFGGDDAEDAAAVNSAKIDEAISRISAGQAQSLREQKPFRLFGVRQINPLEALLSGDPDSVRAAIEADPGVAFARAEGERALTNRQSATGDLMSGGGVKDFLRFNQGLAATQRQQAIENLFRAVGVGQRAADTGASIRGGNDSIIAQLLTGQGGIQGQGIIDAGNARRTGFAGAANVLGGALQTRDIFRGLGLN